MGLLVGIMVVWLAPIVIGYGLGVRYDLLSDTDRLLKLWLLGIVPAIGIYLILIIFSLIGAFTLFLF